MMVKFSLKSHFWLVIIIFTCTGCDDSPKARLDQKDSNILLKNTPVPVLPIPPLPSAKQTTAPEVTHVSGTWIKTYGDYRDDIVEDILPADGGGFYLAGATNTQIEADQPGDAYLLRTDDAGAVLWELTYKDFDAIRAIHPMLNGGLLISGAVTSLENGSLDIFLMELDRDGNEVVSRTFGGPLDELGEALPMPDGGYILWGNSMNPIDIEPGEPGTASFGGFSGHSNIYLARIDAEGNERWSRSFGGNNNVMASSALLTGDGGILILATIMHDLENDDKMTLIKINRNGRKVWSQTWEEGHLDGDEIIQTPPGNYLIAGGFAPTGDQDLSNRDFMFIMVDPDGEEIWKRTFGDPVLFEKVCAIAETADGGYIAVGEVARDLSTSGFAIMLVRLDEYGQPVWQQTIQTKAHTMLSGIVEHPDGGYVISGSIYRGSNYDILLIKTDEDGKLISIAKRT
jgi:hypothetical protein